MNRKRRNFLLRLVITAILIAILVVTTDWRASLSLIAGIPLSYVLLLIAIGLFMITISSLKWQIFLHARAIYVRLPQLILLYIVGCFFNNFLPSNVGGDVVRGSVLARKTGNSADSYGTVLLERLTGVLGLLTLATLAVTVNMAMMRTSGLVIFILTLLGTLLGLFLVLTLLFFTQGASKIVQSLSRWPSFGRIQTKASNFVEVVYSFRSQPLPLVQGMAISLLYHVMTTINTLVVCLALGLQVSVLDIAVIVPLILVVAMVPISINAIGVWEGAFVYFFGLVGIPPPAALSIALVLRLKSLFFALVGGGIFLFWKRMLERIQERDLPQLGVLDSAPNNE